MFPILNHSLLTRRIISCHDILVKSQIFHISKRFSSSGKEVAKKMADISAKTTLGNTTTTKIVATPSQNNGALIHYKTQETSVIPYKPPGTMQKFQKNQLDIKTTSLKEKYGNFITENEKLKDLINTQNSLLTLSEPDNVPRPPIYCISRSSTYSIEDFTSLAFEICANLVTISVGSGGILPINFPINIKENFFQPCDKNSITALSIPNKINVLNSCLEKILENTFWDNNKEGLLRELNVFFDTYYKISDNILPLISREREIFNKIYPRSHSLLTWELEIKNLLEKEKYNNPRVPPYCQHNIQIEKSFISIINTYGQDLFNNDPPVWHELIRRAGVTANVDASATREEVIDDKDPRTMYQPYCNPIIEGQGPKVIAKAYEIMNKNPELYFQVAAKTFSEKDMEEILLKMMQNDIIVGTIKRKDEKIGNLPYLSGDDLHCLATIELKDAYIALTTLTSTNDGNTVKFGDKQYANQNIQERNKAEYFRPFYFLVYIPKAEDIFTVSQQHTELINENTYYNLTVREILSQAVRDAYPIWKQNIVREPISFTPKVIQNVAIKMCEERILELEKMNHKFTHQLRWDSLSEKQQIENIERRNKMQQNDSLVRQKSLSRKQLPEEVKVLWDYKEKLEKEASSHNKTIKKEKKEDFDTKNNKTHNKNVSI